MLEFVLLIACLLSSAIIVGAVHIIVSLLKAIQDLAYWLFAPGPNMRKVR